MVRERSRVQSSLAAPAKSNSYRIKNGSTREASHRIVTNRTRIKATWDRTNGCVTFPQDLRHLITNPITQKIKKPDLFWTCRHDEHLHPVNEILDPQPLNHGNSSKSQRDDLVAKRLRQRFLGQPTVPSRERCPVVRDLQGIDIPGLVDTQQLSS